MVRWLSRQVHQSWLVVWLCVGVIAGMIIGVVLRVNYFGSPLWLVGCIVMLIVAYLRPRCALVVIGVIVGMVLAFYRVTLELKGEDYVRRLYDQEVLVEGVVNGDPVTDDGMTKFRLVGLKFGEDRVESTGNLYVSVGRNEDLAREDMVVLRGEIGAGFGTYAGTLYRPTVVEWKRPEPGSWVLGVRNWFAERIKSVVEEREATLGLSYLLGMKTGLDDELSENLRIVGLTHIVVASGTHLAILVGIARKIFGRMSRFAGLLFSLVFVVFFMAMVGWTPSILRAGLMTILTLVAWYSGRQLAPIRIILMVAAVTLMINPMFLIDMGWLLSFASYSGIMILGPKLVKWFYGARKPGFIGSLLLTTIAATVMTLPIILYYYGAVSLISVVANLLILPTLPYVMGAVFMAGIFAGVPLVSTVVGWCATRMLDFHMMVVGWFAGMKEFLVEIPKYQGQVFLVYLVVGVLLSAGWIWQKRRKKMVNQTTVMDKIC